MARSAQAPSASIPFYKALLAPSLHWHQLLRIGIALDQHPLARLIRDRHNLVGNDRGRPTDPHRHPTHFHPLFDFVLRKLLVLTGLVFRPFLLALFLRLFGALSLDLLLGGLDDLRAVLLDLGDFLVGDVRIEMLQSVTLKFLGLLPGLLHVLRRAEELFDDEVELEHPHLFGDGH